MTRSRAANVALWLVSALLTLLYLAAGVPKIFGLGETVKGFHDMGYSDAFRVFIGLCETAGGVGLLVPRLALWAAAGLVCIMLGAVYTHVANSIPNGWVPAVAGALLLAVARQRRGEALGLAARQGG